jgi:hypothetical protein
MSSKKDPNPRYAATSKPAARASDRPNAPRETTTGPKVVGKLPTGANPKNPRYGMDKIVYKPFPGITTKKK